MRPSIWISFLLFLTLSWFGEAVLAVPLNAPLPVLLKDDRLTVKVADVPLGKILQEISRQSGIKVFGNARIGNEKITVEFSDLSMEEGLGKILSSYNLAYLFSAKKPNGEYPSPQQMTEVWIFPRSENHSSVPRELDFIPLSGKETENPAPSSRQRVIESIIERQDPSGIPILIDFLRDSDPGVRLSAIDALTEVGSPVPADQIAEIALEHNDPQTRMAILTSGIELPLKAIVDHALHDPHPQVRIEALHTLEGYTELEEVARQALKDPDPSVQTTAEEILQSIEEDRNPQMDRGEDIPHEDIHEAEEGDSRSTM